ncbi:hypothetical protein LBMAG35_15730 [Chlorobiota bacterium]|nr:hypothetical protein LBMAG35_15730 [Chlorobiota bacterium]
MHIVHIGNHAISLSDVRDIKVQYDYQENEIYVDLELNGGVQLSLNLQDSVIFMAEFIQKIKEEKQL